MGAVSIPQKEITPVSNIPEARLRLDDLKIGIKALTGLTADKAAHSRSVLKLTRMVDATLPMLDRARAGSQDSAAAAPPRTAAPPKSAAAAGAAKGNSANKGKGIGPAAKTGGKKKGGQKAAAPKAAAPAPKTAAAKSPAARPSRAARPAAGAAAASRTAAKGAPRVAQKASGQRTARSASQKGSAVRRVREIGGGTSARTARGGPVPDSSAGEQMQHEAMQGAQSGDMANHDAGQSTE